MSEKELRDEFAKAALQALHSQMGDIFVASLIGPPSELPAGEQRDYSKKRIDALVSTIYAIADAMIEYRDR